MNPDFDASDLEDGNMASVLRRNAVLEAEILTLRQEQLGFREARLRLNAVLASGAGTFLWQLPHGRLTADAGLKNLLGLTDESAVHEGRDTFLRNIHPEDAPAIRARIGGLLAGDVSFAEEFRVNMPSGKIRWCAARGHVDATGLCVGAVFDITTLKEDDLTLRKANADILTLVAQRTAILSQITEGVIVTDPDGRIVFVNEAAVQIHGAEILDVEPDDYSEAYHLLREDGSPHPPEELPLARAVRDHAEVRDQRWRIRRPDGTEVLAIGSAKPVFRADGERVGAVLALRDDTERHAAEQALALSERRLSAVLNNTRMAIFMVDTRQRCIYLNAAAEALTGYRLGDLAQHPLQKLIRQPSRNENGIENAFLSQDRISGEDVFMHQDGHAFPVAFSASPIRDRESIAVGTIIEARDIREEIAQKEALGESEARLRLAIEAGQMAVWELDVEADTIIGSPELNRLYGFPSDSAPTVDEFRSRFAPGEQERVTEERNQRIARGETKLQSETKHIWPDGTEKWLLMRAQVGANRTGNGTRLIGVVADITEVKQQEARIATVAQELRHRLVNTVTVISALASRSWPPGFSDAKNDFTTRLRAIGKATELMFSKDSTPETAALKRLLAEITGPYRSANHDPFIFAGPDDVTVERHMRPLAMAFHELCTNALKYGALSVTEGKVEIKWNYMADGSLKIEWQEMGGPPVKVPESFGLGSTLLKQLLFSAPNSVTLNHDIGGVECIIIIRD